MNGHRRHRTGAGEALSPPAPLDDMLKANPFSLAWEWLQNRRDLRRFNQMMAEQQRQTPTDTMRRQAALANVAQPPLAPVTPEQQEQIRQYVEQNLMIPEIAFGEE